MHQLATAPSNTRALLSLWAQALPLPPAARESLLAGAPEAPTLGAQRRRLLGLLAQQGGAVLSLRCHCPACGEAAAVDVSPAALLQALPSEDAAPDHTWADGPWQLQFRLPAPADLHALADEADVDRFVQRLLQRCLLTARLDGAAVDLSAPLALPPALYDRLAERMEALDAAATLTLDVCCPACAHTWPALFDPGLAWWTLLQSRAEQSLLDVDTLARRYGWSEDQILALDPVRRQAYLQLARAESEA
jgi:hypothetical protein